MEILDIGAKKENWIELALGSMADKNLGRKDSLMYPISDNEILIAGGSKKLYSGQKSLSDGYVFNIDQMGALR